MCLRLTDTFPLSQTMGKITGYSYYPQFFQDPRTKEKRAVYYPFIQIRISTNDKSISYSFDALVDSGSDRNLFPLYFATYLGIHFKGIKPKKIYGIGDSFIEAYTEEINIWLGTKKFETEADFSPQQRAPLLGRDGFFNLFNSIKFDEKGQFVYIEE